MKSLPYFRWYPADAEGDDFYMSLSHEEFWLYHRCLNRSWMNDGIPADMDELARVFGISRKLLNRLWIKVGQRWSVSPRDAGKLINPRQEVERTYAVTKSSKATESVRTRYERTYERNKDVPLRAYDSVSESSCLLELPIKQEISTRASDLNGQTSQRFDEFWSRYPRTVGKDSACRDWLSVALVVDEPKIFACLENYLASGDVARGAVMNAGSTPRGPGWIIVCFKEDWACRWPAAQQVRSEPRLMYK